jgi:hypothetical protein
MVLGIGEGSIDIVVDGITFSRGDTIKGKVVLDLKKPKKARGFRIRLVADRIEEHYNHKGQRTRRTVILYSKEIALDSEKEYPSGKSEYAFAFQVPDLEPPKPNELRIGPLSVQVGGNPPLSWRLDASLDLPLAFDISKKLAINII